MTGRRLIFAIVFVALVGCESADRRAFNDRIDQREADAADRVEIYESFEAELVAELRDEYGANAEDGCPQIEPLPSVGFNDPAVPFYSSTPEQREEFRQHREREVRARREAWLSNVPGEHCRCLQATIVNVRSALDALDPTQFEADREQITDISDEALAQRVAFTGLPSANQFHRMSRGTE